MAWIGLYVCIQWTSRVVRHSPCRSFGFSFDKGTAPHPVVRLNIWFQTPLSFLFYLCVCMHGRDRQRGKERDGERERGKAKRKKNRNYSRSSLLRGNGISLALTFAAKGFNDGMQSHAGCWAVGAVCTSVRWSICMCHEGWGLTAPPPMQMQDGLNVVLRIMIFFPFHWKQLRKKRKRKEKQKKQTLGGDISA